MNKIYIFALVGVLSFLNVKGQTFKDDFENYTVGDGVDDQSSIWEVWPDPSATDVDVVNSDAYSGKQSLYLGPGPGPQDLVLPFGGEYTEGVFVFSQRMKIPSGKSGYFNFQAYTKPGSGWATDL